MLTLEDFVDGVKRELGGWPAGHLVGIEGFSGNNGVIVDRRHKPGWAEILDAALLRPNRYERQVSIGLPDVRVRKVILKCIAPTRSWTPMSP